MKFCYTCKRYAAKDSTFCMLCGSSFAVRYCSKLHRNPRNADYCKVCGSSDLSQPDIRPKESLLKKMVLISSSAAALALGASVIEVFIKSEDVMPSSKILLLVIMAPLLLTIRRRSRSSQSKGS